MRELLILTFQNNHVWQLPPPIYTLENQGLWKRSYSLTQGHTWSELAPDSHTHYPGDMFTAGGVDEGVKIEAGGVTSFLASRCRRGDRKSTLGHRCFLFLRYTGRKEQNPMAVLFPCMDKRALGNAHFPKQWPLSWIAFPNPQGTPSLLLRKEEVSG